MAEKISVISVIRVRDVLLVTMPVDPDEPTVAALQEKVLSAMEHHEAQAVVLDISTLGTLDEFLARTVSEMARMVSLIDGRLIVAGMQPSVAATATENGLMLGKIETALSVDRALDLAATDASVKHGQ